MATNMEETDSQTELLETTPKMDYDTMNYERFENDEDEDINIEEGQGRKVSFQEVTLHHDNDDRVATAAQSNGAPADGESRLKFYENEDNLMSRAGTTGIVEDPHHDSTGSMSSAQNCIAGVVENIFFRGFTILLILIDVITVIVDLATPDKPKQIEDQMDIAGLVFSCYFVVEVGARIFSKGFRQFVHSWVDLLDAAIVFVSFIVTTVYVALDLGGAAGFSKLLVAGRLIRIFLIVRIFTQRKQVAKASRLMVSENKRRYRKDGFDLDLCYVTERIIAMSFPSSGMMSVYRNPIREVARFFNTKHPGHYKIYNLCSERTYDTSLFNESCERVFIDDHNVPTLRGMVKFVKDVEQWMNADPNNIIAVHCKGGKGRTGTMICTWLVHSGTFQQASDSLEYFGTRRTDLSVGSKFQGVETPSQSRYVGYYEQLVKTFKGELPPEVKLNMATIKLEGLAGVGNGDGSDLTMKIIVNKEEVFCCNFGANINCQVMHFREQSSMVATLVNAPVLVGDIKVRFESSANIPRGYDNCPFFFWFNTSLVEGNKLRLQRDVIDNLNKEKTWKIFKSNFHIEMTFENADSSSA